MSKGATHVARSPAQAFDEHNSSSRSLRPLFLAWLGSAAPVAQVWMDTQGDGLGAALVGAVSISVLVALESMRRDLGWRVAPALAVVALLASMSNTRLGPSVSAITVGTAVVAFGAFRSWPLWPPRSARDHPSGWAAFGIGVQAFAWVVERSRGGWAVATVLVVIMLEIDRHRSHPTRRWAPLAAATAREAIDRTTELVRRRRRRCVGSLTRRWRSLSTRTIGLTSCSVGALFTAAALHALAVAPGIHTALYNPERWPGQQDYLIHAYATANVFPTWTQPNLPHFALHLAVRATDAILGVADPRLGMLVVMVVLTGAFGALVTAYFARQTIAWRHGTAVALLAGLVIGLSEAPAGIIGWQALDPPQGFLPFNMAHLPTSFGSRVLILALMLGVCGFLRGRLDKRFIWVPTLALLTVSFKPTLPQLIAVVALGWAFRHRDELGGERRLRLITQRLFLPVVAASLVQLWIANTQMVTADQRRSLHFDPAGVFGDIGAWHPAFWSALAFPLVSAIAFRRTMRASLEVGISAACLLLAIGLATLLTPRSDNDWGADLFQFVHAANFVLAIAMTAALLKAVPSMSRRERRLAAVVSSTWIPYLASGIGLWGCAGLGLCLVS